MKKTLMFVLALFFAVFSACSQRTLSVSILGDSYSTFRGYVEPDTNICWYCLPPNKHVTDVKHVRETWWQLFLRQKGYLLCKNNSFSGSTICNTGYEGNDYSDRSFIRRMDNLGSPDIILVFGGTNDAWAGVPLGENVYSGWTPQSLYSYRPAMCYMFEYLKNRYPSVSIYFILNNDLKEDYTISSIEICRHYEIPCIQLRNIDKITGHPSVRGMQQICDQISSVIK